MREGRFTHFYLHPSPRGTQIGNTRLLFEPYSIVFLLAIFIIFTMGSVRFHLQIARRFALDANCARHQRGLWVLLRERKRELEHCTVSRSPDPLSSGDPTFAPLTLSLIQSGTGPMGYAYLIRPGPSPARVRVELQPVSSRDRVPGFHAGARCCDGENWYPKTYPHPAFLYVCSHVIWPAGLATS